MMIALVLLFATMVNSLPKKPPKAKTGAPGEGICSDCHIGAGLDLGPGFVALAFSGSGNKYKVGKNYTITVSVFDTTKTRFGFETVSLDANNNQAGTPSETDKINTTLQKDESTGKRYMSNYTGTGMNVWTYKWKAPATDIGDITFYGAGNATNWNDAVDGDNVYSTTMVVKPKPLKMEEPIEQATTEQAIDFSVYPNPVVTGFFHVAFNVTEEEMVEIDVFNMQGQFIQPLYKAMKEIGKHDQTLHLISPLKPGIYLVGITAGNERAFSKVVFGL